MNMEEVVMKLIGPVRPVGDSNEDRNRLNNTRNLTELIGRLLKTVGDLSTYDNRHEASMRLIGIHAGEFLDDEISCLAGLRGCPSCEDHKELEDELLAWAEAYPLAVFPEPDFDKAHKILTENGMTLDSISASNMRHVITRVKEIILRRRSKDEGVRYGLPIKRTRD